MHTSIIIVYFIVLVDTYIIEISILYLYAYYRIYFKKIERKYIE